MPQSEILTGVRLDQFEEYFTGFSGELQRMSRARSDSTMLFGWTRCGKSTFLNFLWGQNYQLEPFGARSYRVVASGEPVEIVSTSHRPIPDTFYPSLHSVPYEKTKSNVVDMIDIPGVGAEMQECLERNAMEKIAVQLVAKNIKPKSIALIMSPNDFLAEGMIMDIFTKLRETVSIQSLNEKNMRVMCRWLPNHKKYSVEKVKKMYGKRLGQKIELVKKEIARNCGYTDLELEDRLHFLQLVKKTLVPYDISNPGHRIMLRKEIFGLQKSSKVASRSLRFEPLNPRSIGFIERAFSVISSSFMSKYDRLNRLNREIATHENDEKRRESILDKKGKLTWGKVISDLLKDKSQAESNLKKHNLSGEKIKKFITQKINLPYSPFGLLTANQSNTEHLRTRVEDEEERDLKERLKMAFDSIDFDEFDDDAYYEGVGRPLHASTMRRTPVIFDLCIPYEEVKYADREHSAVAVIQDNKKRGRFKAMVYSSPILKSYCNISFFVKLKNKPLFKAEGERLRKQIECISEEIIEARNDRDSGVTSRQRVAVLEDRKQDVIQSIHQESNLFLLAYNYFSITDGVVCRDGLEDSIANFKTKVKAWNDSLDRELTPGLVPASQVGLMSGSSGGGGGGGGGSKPITRCVQNNHP